MAQRGGFYLGASAPIASLTLVAAPKQQSTGLLFFTACSNPPFILINKTKESILVDKLFYYGAERGIRTLGTVLVYTRFPIVRNGSCPLHRPPSQYLCGFPSTETVNYKKVDTRLLFFISIQKCYKIVKFLLKNTAHQKQE